MLESTLHQLWLNGLAIIPMVIVAALICRWLPCRAATRHAMWLIVLAMFFVPTLILIALPDDLFRPTGLGSANLAAQADPRRMTIADDETDAIDPTVAIETESAGEPATVRPEGRAVSGSSFDNQTTDPRLTTSRTNRETVRHRERRSETGWPRKIDSFTGPKSGPIAAKPQGGTLASSAEVQSHAVPDGDDSQLTTREQTHISAAESLFRQDREMDHSEIGRTDADTSTDASEPQLAHGQSLIQPAAGGFGRWMLAIVQVRDALAAVPPIPALLWAGGAAMIFCLLVIRALRVQRIIRSARPAPPHVVELVETAAREIGLTGVPEIIMVRQRIAPMLWCGRRVTLILPESLWSQLDDVSRFSIILHELAHLKRRDHWVCRVEVMLSAVYWWHPLMWWIRRRIREEADFCCDAWVTLLLPSGRRAYAQALLESRRYTSAESLAGPALGLGAGGSRAKRFARRLTMVMTEHRLPGISRNGAALILAVTAAGCIVGPMAACPPESKAAQKDKVRVEKKLHPVVAPAAPKAPEGTTFETFMREGADDDDRAPGLVAPPGAGPRNFVPPSGIPSVTTVPTVPRATYLYDDPIERRIERLELRLEQLARALERVGVSPGPAEDLPAMENPDSGKVVIRRYELPEGKLKELIDLMIREDVPILVTPKQDQGAIDVHATERNHRTFKAFLDMIHPEGTAAEIPAPQTRADEALQMLNRTRLRELGAAEYARQVEAARSALLAGHQQQAKSFLAQAQALFHQAESLGQEAEAVEEEADRIEERASEVRGEEQQTLRRHARELRTRARELERMIRDLERQAEQFEAQAERLEEHMEEIEEEREKDRDHAKED